MICSMARENPAQSRDNVKSLEDQPRVGVPYRSTNEEVSGAREKYAYYLRAIEKAGGKPVEISLQLSPAELTTKAYDLDAFVLPGSGADVDPVHYGAARHPKANPPDLPREKTDFTLLEHAFAEGKPVLAICYGIQSLNVFCGGSLIQDIPSELGTKIQHPWDRSAGSSEPFHLVRFEAASRLSELAGEVEVRVNSSHHQAIREPGKNLRIVAWAPDGVVEAVVGTGGDSAWITGVQWHPERMVGDALAQALFRGVVEAARLRKQTVGSRGK
jgi:putative glutamine amidotransferase